MRTSPSAVFDDGTLRLARRAPPARRRALRHAARVRALPRGGRAARAPPAGLGLAPRPRRRAACSCALLRPPTPASCSRTSRAPFPEKGARGAAPDRPRVGREPGRRVLRVPGGLALDASTTCGRASRYDGVENLEAARARGKGVILLSAHFGSWELGALAAGQLGEPISVGRRGPLDNPLTRGGDRAPPHAVRQPRHRQAGGAARDAARDARRTRRWRS